MTKTHSYSTVVEWTGARELGTASYQSYSRDHVIGTAGKPPIAGSADPAFRGDASRYNPEELLVASVSTCHMLWYLHLCADAGVTVVSYRDEPLGTMVEESDGRGRFTGITLRPRVRVAAGALSTAVALHARAHEFCFVANSLNFAVVVEPAVDGAPPWAEA